MYTYFRYYSIVLLSILASCSKKDSAPPEQGTGADSIYGKLITVTNLQPPITGDQDPTSATRPPLYFSLEENKAVPAEYAKTNRWDIAFTGIYNSFLSGNNGTNSNNLGAGGPGKGGIFLIQQAFNDIQQIPTNDQFKTGLAVYGTDDSGDFGAGLGWYLYDFSGTIRGDGSYDKQHLVYPIANRILVVKTAKGNYAKIRMLSLYQNETDSTKWKRNTPHPFYTFEYIIVKNSAASFDAH